MANNHTVGSDLIPIPKELIPEAMKIAGKTLSDILHNDGYCGVFFKETPEGICLFDDECLCIDHAEIMARAIIEGLGLDMFVFNWAMYCDKPRPGEFGGGAFCIERGAPTIWVDAYSEALKIASRRRKNAENIKSQR